MPMPTVAIDVPSAHVLADQASIISELQFVMDSCKRLLTELAKPEEERDQLIPLALWSSAVLAYGRCFSKGRRFALASQNVKDLPLHGAVMNFHQWILEERDKLAARAVDARSEARIAYDTYRGTYDIARFWQDRVLPLRRTVSHEVALRYNNGVLAGDGLRADLFKFLSDARMRISAEASALDARRDFDLAAVDLQAALTTGGEPASSMPSPSMQ